MTALDRDGSRLPEDSTGIGDASPVPSTVRRTRRRRRPSGAPPPLPRSLGQTGRAWIIGLVALVAWLVVALLSPRVRRFTDRVDAAILRAVARLRTDWLVDVARGIDRVATGWAMFFVAIALLVATVAFKRWRHLFTFLGSVLVLEVLGLFLIERFRRPRPYDVTTIGRWRGYSLPSATAAVVSFTVVGAIYMLVVPGRSRTIAKIAGIVGDRRLRRSARLPGDRPPVRRARRRRHRGRHPAQRLPVLHPERGRSRDAARRQDRAPRHRRSAWRRAAPVRCGISSASR